jgi:hypothetical protein
MIRFMSMISRATDALNLFLARRLTRRVEPRADQALSEAITGTATPIELYAYLTNLFVAWSGLVLPAALLALASAFVGNQIDGNRGNEVGLAIGMGSVAFCMVGAADAAWRRRIAKAARGRYLRNEFVLDEPARRRMRIARVNDGTLVLQTVIAVITAWRIW